MYARYILFFMVAAGIQAMAFSGSLAGKASYYYPTSHNFREIYGSGAMYGIEGQFSLYKELFLDVGGSVFPKSGSSIISCSVPGSARRFSTTLYLVPIDFGLKAYLRPSEYIHCFVGACMTPFYVYIHDKSPYVDQKRTRFGFGGSFKGGMRILPWRNGFFLGIFADYYLMEAQFSSNSQTSGRKADFSGLSAGGDVGYRF